MKKVILSILMLMASTAMGAYPDVITDPSVREAIDFIDQKVNAALISVTNPGFPPGILPITSGGTGSGTAAGALSNLGAPNYSGQGAVGTWPISVTGNAATANTATNFSGSLAGHVTGTQFATVVGSDTHRHTFSTVDISSVTARIETKVAKAGDTMTGSLIMDRSSITFTNGGAIQEVNYVKMSTSFAETGLHEQGRIHWDINDETMGIDMGNDIHLQVGQEMLFKAKMVGSAGLNGQVVAITGASGERPTIVLADANDPTINKLTMGVLTQGINQNNNGFFNAFGYVRDIDLTAFNEGDILYLSDTPGQMTNIPPQYPSRIIKIGRAVKVTGVTAGILFVNIEDVPDAIVISSVTSSEYWGDISSTTGLNRTEKDLFAAIKDPTGFTDNTTSSITLTGRVFQIAGTNFSYYYNGNKVTVSTSSISVPDTSRTNWIYYNSTGTLSCSATFPGFYMPLVATVYYSTSVVAGLLSDERHTAIMDWRTHEYLHETIGARWSSGMALAYPAINNNITSSTVGVGEFYDDDLEIVTPITSRFTLVYFNGGPNPEFVYNSTWPVKTTPAGIPQWNNGLSLANGTAAKFYVYFLYATANPNSAVYSVTGQGEYATIAAAQAITPADISLIGFPSAEVRPIYKITVKMNLNLPQLQEVVDYRSQTSLPSGNYNATSHASLTNLGLTVAGHPYDVAGGFASWDNVIHSTDAIQTQINNVATSTGSISSVVSSLNTWTLSTGTAFGGDVTGTYGATVVGNDSHTHNFTTVNVSTITARIETVAAYTFTGSARTEQVAVYTATNSARIEAVAVSTGSIQSTYEAHASSAAHEASVTQSGRIVLRDSSGRSTVKLMSIPVYAGPGLTSSYQNVFSWTSTTSALGTGYPEDSGVILTAVKDGDSNNIYNGGLQIFSRYTNQQADQAHMWIRAWNPNNVKVFGDWSKMWDDGNDGSGSGLDADLLDGIGHSSANTVSTIVSRDSSGNFSAGTITATSFVGALSGNANTATTATTATNWSGSTALQSQVNNIAISTGQIQVSLNLVIVSTGSLQGQIDALVLSTGTIPGYGSANVANTLVLRDASGNFSAGTITAALAGNATTASNATNAGTSVNSNNTYNLLGGTAGAIPYQSATDTMQYLSSGTAGYILTTNGVSAPTWTNATSANTASAIVKRDASGNFTAGTVTAAIAGNAATATTATTATHIAGGSQFALPYQTAAGTTSMLAKPASASALVATGLIAPDWQVITPNNTASALVQRDGSGNFSAGTITGSLAGNATTATTATTTTGNAGTATALAADPADCSSPNFALGVNASGTASCAIVPVSSTATIVTSIDNETSARISADLNKLDSTGTLTYSMLAATNTWTGKQNFQTVTSTSVCINNDCRTTFSGYKTVATINLVAATTTTITGLKSGTFYKIIYMFTQNTSAGFLEMLVNSKVAGYNWVTHTMNTAAGTTVTASGTGTFFHLNYSGVGPAAAGAHQGEYHFYHSGTRFNIWGTSVYPESSFTRADISGTLVETSSIFPIAIFTSAGTLTGTIYVQEFIP